MLESVREIHGHVNKQLTNHSSVTEREIAKEFRCFLSSNFVAQLVKSKATCDVRQATFNKVACLSTKLPV